MATRTLATLGILSLAACLNTASIAATVESPDTVVKKLFAVSTNRFEDDANIKRRCEMFGTFFRDNLIKKDPKGGRCHIDGGFMRYPQLDGDVLADSSKEDREVAVKTVKINGSHARVQVSYPNSGSQTQVMFLDSDQTGWRVYNVLLIKNDSCFADWLNPPKPEDQDAEPPKCH